jgi:peptide/nickel transport system permease protein
MIKFILRRLVLLVPVFVGLTLLVFTISHILPGDPVKLAAGPQATAEEIASLTREFGMDRPLPQQYWHYATGLLHGDWGQSVLTRRPVAADLKIYLPATLELVFAAILLAILIGIPAGLLSAITANQWPDYLTRILSLASIAMPRFFLALVLQLVFAMSLAWLPLNGRFPIIDLPPPTVTGMLTIDSLLAGDWLAFTTSCEHLLMPALAMSLSPLATITRMMRASTLDVLQQDYVLTERALGLSQSLIILKYVLRNAFSSTLTVIGLYIGWLLSGSVLVETVFDWPGIGLYATKAIVTQDFMPVMGVTLSIGFIFVLVNLVIDLLYGVINPKVRYQ